MYKTLCYSLTLFVMICGLLFTQNAAVINQASQDFIEVGKIAIPAVVFIQVRGTPSKNNNGFYPYESPYDEDDLFGKFFGIPSVKIPNQMEITQASGFLVSPDGYILTNHHVVKGHAGANITVRLNDGREFPGKVVGTDESTEVALLKIDAQNLPYVKLGNSDDLQVGQWVVAIGTPLGLQASLTVGVVSAKGRSNLDIARIEDFIQTDAALNRGNSGGPLLNLKGEVVGINTAIATNLAEGYMGIGFAIPSNIAKMVMDQIRTNGTIKRGYIGVGLQDIDSNLAQSFDLSKVEGALVIEVVKDSPADKAGLKQGDIILKFNQKPVENMGSLRSFVAMQKPGTKITLSIWRDKKMQDIPVEIGTLNEAIESDSNSNPVNNSLGIEVQTLTSEFAKSVHMQDQSGVIVTKVDPTSPAAFVGIKKGAVILSVNNQKITSKEEYQKNLDATPKGKPVLLLIRQGNVLRYVAVEIGG